MATVWVALLAEAAVLVAVAGALTSWIRRSEPAGHDRIIESTGPAELV
ncbi:hypothetical protein GCM10009854_33360 [Saccharopolyspora halophila]|uniref:Uncharacterized protein n=1 Tax=Saccharopolyspora halophila TaxID=405551 RepID=A0ABN3GIQ3_9PSEU